MDIGSLLLGLALLLVIAFIVARPLLEQTAAPERAPGPVDDLLGRRESVLTQLRDLDFDYAMSKINQVDYTAQRAQLVAEGVAILKQLDTLGPVEPTGPRPAVSLTPNDEIEAAVARMRARRAAEARPAAEKRDLDAEIESSVAARRAASPARSSGARLPVAEKAAGAERLICPQCGAEVLPNDRFCPQCGSALTVACGNCGRVARAGDQFCASCGQSLPAPVAGLRTTKAQS